MDLHRKQLYGTQLIQNRKTQKKYPGKFVLYPVRDFKNVNTRRKNIGFKTTVEEYTGEAVRTFEELPSSGSNRRYFRIGGADTTLIGAKGTSIEENKAFWAMACHFRSKGLNVPQVLAHSDDFACYLQEDLGNDTLFSMVAEGREKGAYSPAERALIIKAVRALPRIQFEGAEGLDFSVCFPPSAWPWPS